uniref:ExbD/TolR family protein n=1 Tax=Ningiella ruwaisensis TaxID=2364274 RepID=UPI00109F14B1|nr:biopolymer transporter ExbD [Ningiella ruwaisensis]
MIANRRARVKKEDADLDITSFMNLMIVLVPVLLMMMVFSRITVVELNLPGLAGQTNSEAIEREVLEVQVTDSGLEVYFPQTYLVTQIPMIEVVDDQSTTVGSGQIMHDYASLQTTLKQIKQTLLGKGVDKKDITLLMQKDTDYQTIISLIDATRSYKDVVAASVVDAELFPEVSLADAPVSISKASNATMGENSTGGSQ